MGIEAIEKLIKEEKWEEAAEFYVSYLTDHSFSEKLSVLGATIAYHMRDLELARLYIRRGLERNIYNYELYFILGDCYLDSNPNQAYLCYENALYYCEKEHGHDYEDTEYIRNYIIEFKWANHITVEATSFIILSWNTLELTKACIESVRENCYESAYELVLVDNASTDGSVEYLKSLDCIKTIFNEENRGFARGCNQGIALAKRQNDIFLLNSDTEMTPNALFLMRLELYGKNDTGAVGAITNCAGNAQTIDDEIYSSKDALQYALKYNLPTLEESQKRGYLIGFAELIKREVLDKVGGLNEEYPIGNYEDNDLGMRIMKAGYTNRFLDNAFIYHLGSESFRKNNVDYMQTMENNAFVFYEKWKISPEAFNIKKELLCMLPKSKEEKFSLLQVGCGSGALLEYIKHEYPYADIHGIESDERFWKLPPIYSGVKYAKKGEISFDNNSMDYILLDHVLEKTTDAKELLHTIQPYLKENGAFIINLYNLSHVKNIYNQLFGKAFDFIEGALGREYSSAYTFNKIDNILTNCKLEMTDLRYVRKPMESTAQEPYASFVEGLKVAFPAIQTELLDAYSFLIKAKETRGEFIC